MEMAPIHYGVANRSDCRNRYQLACHYQSYLTERFSSIRVYQRANVKGELKAGFGFSVRAALIHAVKPRKVNKFELRHSGAGDHRL